MVLKTGTVLSKANGLVQRFSEDVDLGLTDDVTRSLFTCCILRGAAYPLSVVICRP
ncbi:nucleotidyl transferase AbiEii/AbiGii toxin family protein [Siccationidurans soli]|uniref:Nucleotidyl transferase AbiEii/AbiGii toxin family protein n=1 Tax=Hymenobacter negativus TaxID=2795026 RepID=A0ABS3QP21_9BACT|nr:nucleotidyl transferase AbiEii/AbiGii toxin family protein [Hymenobacter negativus]